MTELAKIESPHVSRNLSARTAVAAIIALLIAVQVVYVVKHSVTFAAVLASAPFGIVAP